MKIIHLKRVKMEVTPFGGLLLVHDFIRNIGLEAFVKDRFPSPDSNRGRSPWQFISSTILTQHAEGMAIITSSTFILCTISVISSVVPSTLLPLRLPNFRFISSTKPTTFPR